MYFILLMMNNNTDILSGITDQHTYSVLSQTLSFSMSKYAHLYYDGNPLELMDYRFSQMFLFRRPLNIICL